MAPRGWYARLCSGFYFQLFIIAKRRKVAMAPTSMSRSELSGRWDRITGHGREAAIVQSPAEMRPAAQESLLDKTAPQGHRRPSLSLSPCRMRIQHSICCCCCLSLTTAKHKFPRVRIERVWLRSLSRRPYFIKMQPVPLAGCMKYSRWERSRRTLCVTVTGQMQAFLWSTNVIVFVWFQEYK